MSVGVVMLAHTALDRAAQVIRHWASSGCPVVVHVDKRVRARDYIDFATSIEDLPQVQFSKRHACEWGTWGIVAATQAASAQMLTQFPQVNHVVLASGACLPLRPVRELRDYLADRPETDFIESATTHEVNWAVGGLQEERFTLRFPFGLKRHPVLFDGYTALQRRLNVKRRLPFGLVPHIGSQWWCLTRQTLSAILQDPLRPTYDRYFRRVWVPDECYFQTLVRRHATQVESRSLTLSKFDFDGKPYIFYDDHLQLLRRSGCFMARKIWPRADKLYEAFLSKKPGRYSMAEPNPVKIERIFDKSVERRVQGRAGLHMQSSCPREDWENGLTAAPYSVFQGFSDLFVDFEGWLADETGAQVHGHLFAPDRAHFSDGNSVVNGALTHHRGLRDHNPHAFLTNLIWNTRGQHQCFQFGPSDNQAINWRVSKDPNAQISVITGAWAIPLFQSQTSFDERRKAAARLQRIESEHLAVLRSIWTRARVRIWTLADFIEAPIAPLHSILDEVGPAQDHRLTRVPLMVDLTGFGQFLQDLKNEGMHPTLMGHFPVAQPEPHANDARAHKPYLVR